ncbi:MAG: hypothetical protein FWD60_05480 [Candidatus Azobacteroides sp.]|nr:hypothetical protein [Candidatus Azobacteroides sp.]
MRYYFDTNILVFILFDKRLDDNCDKNVREIKPFTEQHVITYGKLSLTTDHKDPNDHMREISIFSSYKNPSTKMVNFIC